MAQPVLPPIDAADLTAADVTRYERVAATRGSVPNVFKTLAHSAATMEVVADLGSHLRFQSGLDGPLREAVVLAIARDTMCEYEWSHHWHLADRNGVSAQLLHALSQGVAGRFPAPLGTAVRVARALTAATTPDPADVDELRLHLGPSGLVDLLVLIGYYRLLAGVINTLAVPLEDGLTLVPFTGDGESL
ncbi:MAG: carboxymuconolactone decarboxylase family protein [Ilumatobacteraceae bacterium]|nr:carboxymuconolactone decarboxylase family protein [Ilumatobacteraceae bacterium]